MNLSSTPNTTGKTCGIREESDFNPGATALITGATSGMGAGFARKLAGMGYNLILTGRREDKINELKNEIQEKHKVNIEVIIAELSKEDDIQKLINRIQNIPTPQNSPDIPNTQNNKEAQNTQNIQNNIEFLVNNAGFGTKGEFIEEDIETHIKMIDVHITASVRLCYAIIPLMKARKKGVIINISSVGGFLPSPQNSIYGGSKSCLTFFSQSLSMELKDDNIKVQALCPGFTRTDFHERLDYPPEMLKDQGIIRWMTVEDVVEHSFRDLKKNRVVSIPGFWNRFITKIIRFLPYPLYQSLILSSLEKMEKTEKEINKNRR